MRASLTAASSQLESNEAALAVGAQALEEQQVALKDAREKRRRLRETAADDRRAAQRDLLIVRVEEASAEGHRCPRPLCLSVCLSVCLFVCLFLYLFSYS